MQLKTAASTFVCGPVRKDVRACPIVGPHQTTIFTPLAGPWDRSWLCGRSDLVSGGRYSGGVEYRRASRDIEHLGSAHTDAHPDRQFVLPGRGHIAVVTAEDPQPDDLRQALAPIHTQDAH